MTATSTDNVPYSFMPPPLPNLPGWDLAARIHTAREVGGDFYDAFLLPSGNLVFLVADICGRGVTAAVFMSQIRAMLRHGIEGYYGNIARRPEGNGDRPGTPFERGQRPFIDPDPQGLIEAVNQINRFITTVHWQSGMFVTLFLALLESESGRLAYVNCGHNPPLLLNEARLRHTLPPTGPAVGLRRRATFAPATLDLIAGDCLLAYTDGLTEARDKNGRFFATAPLYHLTRTGSTLTAQAVVDQLHAQVQAHLGNSEPIDDITTLALLRQAGT
jgi:phosphoserine phosphatase RsbU/P